VKNVTWVNYLLYLIGIVLVIMGIMAIANKPIEYTPKEPVWHAALKIIFGLIVIYIGYIVV
jgi:uncharacterized membrane protein